MNEFHRGLWKHPEYYLPVLDYLEAGTRDFHGIANRTWLTEDEVAEVAAKVRRKGLDNVRRHYETLAAFRN